jgi:alpha-tubulin suppressor-like RCC1 family protein
MNRLKPILLLVLIFEFVAAFCYSASIGAGYYHSLFICSDGTVRACGMDYGGELGDSSQTWTRPSPVTVIGLSGIVDATGGMGHSLFLKNDGTVWAVGANDYGQLGDGTTNVHIVAFQVPGLTNIIQIAAGEIHSLFLKSDSSVWVCGRNANGQLGNGTTTNSLSPIQVPGLTNIKAIGAGQDHSLFVKGDGTVYACGWNFQGELGDGTTTDRHSPVQVLNVSGIVAASHGNGSQWSVFLKNDGTVYACGKNDYGQLGDGTTNTSHTPFQVPGLTGIDAVSCGYAHVLYHKNDNTLWVCGINQTYGALGDGTLNDRHTASQVAAITDVEAVCAGNGHSIILFNSGVVETFGHNGDGALGIGTHDLNPHSIPVAVPGLCTVFTSTNESTIRKNWKLLFGNPQYNDQFECTLTVSSKEKISFEIYDMQGVLLKREMIFVTPGNNFFSVDIKKLRKGIYFIRFSNEMESLQERFVRM